MADLSDHFVALIREEGPISIATFMADALGHPERGYYMARDPLGAAGDFTTAPEISQVFGELIGLWCAHIWERMDRPSPVRLVELGPGRGTLMADLLRATHVTPDFADAVDIHLVETSPALKAAQHAQLGNRPTWHRRFEDIPEGPMLLIANEFFDALPIRQFVQTDRGWCERCVGVSEDTQDKNTEPHFEFVLAPHPIGERMIPTAIHGASVGSIAEYCPAGQSLAAQIGGRLTKHLGAALIIDYGHTQSAAGDTLQAVHKHAYHAPLEAPGTADLTAHVDFQSLAKAAHTAGAKVMEPTTQAEYLHAMGITERAARLTSNATVTQKSDIAAAMHRLTAPDQMGTLFKALCLCHPDLSDPPGFAHVP